MKKRQSLSLLILMLGIILLIFWLPANRAMLSSGEVRAAMDIGSGATNMKIAKVDPKTDKIVAVLLEKSIPVPYQKHLEQSKDNTFDQPVMDQGIKAIKTLKEIAESYGVKKVVAVATAAFRQASNTPQFTQEIEKQTGVKVRVINQDEEGIIAFRGALALTPVKPENTVVWDIGGGSMQLTTLSSEGTYVVEKGKTATVPFKNAVIEKIEHKDINTTHSPNPMTVEEMKAAAAMSKQLAEQSDPFIKAKLADPATQVLAVGNLFNISIRFAVDKSIVPQKELETSVMEWAGKTDAELPGGSFADVTVTNGLLVLGYMQGLNIPQVELVSVNNADGALTYPAYWQAE
jgi:exopolyphosphatase / guanosine-5'-triphosphate,3'-diphosphate pyrophosphatase